MLFWPIIAPLLVLFFKAGFYSSLFIFFIIPSLYLSIINRRVLKRLVLFSVIFLPITIAIDYIMEFTQGWHVSSITESYRIFGYASLENVVWAFVFIYFVVAFYETFLHDHIHPKIYYPQIKYLILLVFILSSIFLLELVIDPILLNINYFYLKFGLLLFIPPIIFILWKAPHIWRKLIKTELYFFFLFFGYELTALNLNQWAFPVKDQLLGFITIGRVRFPYEEFIFWILLSAMAIVSYFEIFDDDGR